MNYPVGDFCADARTWDQKLTLFAAFCLMARALLARSPTWQYCDFPGVSLFLQQNINPLLSWCHKCITNTSPIRSNES